VEIVEPKLGDVVSGDLWSLVNKLCETDHEQLLRCRLMLLVARLVKLSSNRSRTAGRQLFKFGDRLPTVIFSLPFGTL